MVAKSNSRSANGRNGSRPAEADEGCLRFRPDSPAFGFALSSEENPPAALVKQAALAEQAGFDFVSISDHFHPWVPKQGNSPFVWAVLGGIAQVTERIFVGTGVTCPTMRMHPAIVAHAAATIGTMLEGRFWLGLGTGEALNELVVGERWPSGEERIERLQEALDILEALFSGEVVDHDGPYYTVSEAKLFTRPARPVPIAIAAASPGTARLAAAHDGLVATSPDEKVFAAFEQAGGKKKPRLGQITICWGENEAKAKKTAREYWPTTVIGWDARSAIPTPAMFEDVTRSVSEDEIAQNILCGPDLGRVTDEVKKYLDAGFDHVYFHQVGPLQEEFLQAAQRELLPTLGELAKNKGRRG